MALRSEQIQEEGEIHRMFRRRSLWLSQQNSGGLNHALANSAGLDMLQNVEKIV